MILFNKQIDILLFIWLSSFHINKMTCLIFCVKKNYVSYTYNRETLASAEKKASIQRYSNLSLLKKFS